jgi:hypothetical protein
VENILWKLWYRYNVTFTKKVCKFSLYFSFNVHYCAWYRAYTAIPSVCRNIHLLVWPLVSSNVFIRTTTDANGDGISPFSWTEELRLLGKLTILFYFSMKVDVLEIWKVNRNTQRIEIYSTYSLISVFDVY